MAANIYQFTSKRTLIVLSLQPILQAVMGLQGIPSQTSNNWADNNGAGYDAIMAHLTQLTNVNELALCECIISIIMMNSFIFQRGEDADAVVKTYLESFEKHDATYPNHYVTIYRCFYGGLISFHYYRKTKNEYWLERGSYTMKKMEAWNRDCQWNFQNKGMLGLCDFPFLRKQLFRS